MNHTILNIIHSFFNEDKMGEKQFTFQEIFERVESILTEDWLNNNKSATKEKIREVKMGEIYKLLTVDGNFIRHEDGTWSKRKINENS
ncbi:MAG: DNA-directed RNA polymerase subunit delta [Metamycoplasmataceae bacterium]